MTTHESLDYFPPLPASELPCAKWGVNIYLPPRRLLEVLRRHCLANLKRLKREDKEEAAYCIPDNDPATTPSHRYLNVEDPEKWVRETSSVEALGSFHNRFLDKRLMDKADPSRMVPRDRVLFYAHLREAYGACYSVLT